MELLHQELDIEDAAMIKAQASKGKAQDAYLKAKESFKDNHAYSKRLNEMSIFINKDKKYRHTDEDFLMDNVKLEELFFEFLKTKSSK